MYVLTDLLIVTAILNHKESVDKVIHFDHTSFIHKSPDGKYFSNILFICGKYETIHLLFDNYKDRDTELRVIGNLLNSIYDNENKRRNMMHDKKV